MTERRGRAARWNAALVLVPSSAALFGGAVAWAANTTPAATTTTSPPQAVTTAPTVAPSVDARVLAERQRLERRIAAHHKHAKALAHRLAQLRTQAAKVGAVVAAPPPIVYSGGGSGGGQLPAAPAPVQAPAPAPPPPVNANTGASGHP